MILPLINTMMLKTGTSMETITDGQAAVKPGAGKARRSAARTGLMVVGLLTVAATTFKIAKRRSP